MIAYIEGPIRHIQDDALIIVVGGIGYAVHVPRRLFESLKPGQTVELFTHHHVREDAEGLFGFSNYDDLLFFEQLLQVAGVGTRIAMTLLSQFPAEDVKRAIIHGDIAMLTSVSGIGKKTAERIVIDLKESIGVVSSTASKEATGARPTMSAVDALLSLGYTRSAAIESLQGVDTTQPVEEQVRAALKKAAGK